MIKTFQSRYVALDAVTNSEKLITDFKLFSDMICDALRWEYEHRATTKKKSSAQTKKGQRGSKPTLHTYLKDEYKTSDYFVTAIEAQVNGKVRSAQECFNLRIDSTKERVESLKNQIQKKDKKIANLMKVKQSLIERSKSKTALPPKLKTYKGCKITTRDIFCDGEYCRTEFTVSYDRKRDKKRIVVSVYDNDYLFETQYVDAKIRTIKWERNQIAGRLHNTEKQLESLTYIAEHERIPCNLVSLSRQKKWRNSGVKDINSMIKNHRCTEMVLAGRRDAKQGNYMVRYDVGTHTLHISHTSEGISEIVIPNVVFPYGQSYVDKAVSAEKKFRKTVAWGIRVHSKKIQVTCICDVEATDIVTGDVCYGAVGIDKNYDNFAITETNLYGCRINSKTISFDLEGGSSGKNDNILSEALEEVFKYCASVKKPLVCEDIKKIKHVTLYQPKKRNRRISMFAHRKMDALITSKAEKYGVEVIKVDPAYTSVIGRYKYAPMYHISVHSAASLVIARRGQGYRERVPKSLQHKVSQKNKNCPDFAQWKDVMKSA